jgi:hypothetical protein
VRRTGEKCACGDDLCWGRRRHKQQEDSYRFSPIPELCGMPAYGHLIDSHHRKWACCRECAKSRGLPLVQGPAGEARP